MGNGVQRGIEYKLTQSPHVIQTADAQLWGLILLLVITEVLYYTMNVMLLKTLARCKMNVAANFIHFNEPLHLAAFCCLFVQLICEALINTLLDAFGIVESPAL